MSDKPWLTLSSKITYQNPWMTVREDRVKFSEEREGIYGFVDLKPGVFVIALTQDDKIHIIESFRYPTQTWQWELPTGGIDTGLTPLEAAKRELAEELGMSAEKWTHINTFGPSCSGVMKDTQDVFIAKGLSATGEQPEESEAIRTSKAVSFDEIMGMVADGTLSDGQTLAALMQYFVWQQRNK